MDLLGAKSGIWEAETKCVGAGGVAVSPKQSWMKISCSNDLGQTTTYYYSPLENMIPKLQLGLADSRGQFKGENILGKVQQDREPERYYQQWKLVWPNLPPIILLDFLRKNK